jgi:hypothetical protein
MRKLLAIGGLVSLIAVPVAGSSAQAAGVTPPSGNITVDVVTLNGSGCPLGSAVVKMQSDNTGFKVVYSEYLATTGPKLAATEARKNCQLNLLVHIPSGFTFAVEKTEYRGWAGLAKGAVGIQDANYYFQGESASATVSHTFNGPLTGMWKTQDVAAVLAYAPCGATRNLNVNTSLRVDQGSADASSVNFMTMRSQTTDVWTLFNLAWKKC